jgi:tetratricopeptide (TPR) repeat protein
MTSAPRNVKHLPLCAAVRCCLGVLGTLRVHAHAQDDTEKPQSQQSLEAKAAHERGIVAFSNGEFGEAIAAFVEADRLWPNPALSYNIARAYEQLHDDVHAVNYYRDYLRRSPRAADHDAVTAQVERLTQHMAADLQTVHFTAHPKGAVVWIDNEPIGASPAKVRLLSGTHRASFRKPGYQTRDLEFTLAHGETARDVEVTLESIASQANAAGSRGARTSSREVAMNDEIAAEKERDRSKMLLRDLGMTAMLAGVGALGGAMVFELMRADAERNAKRQTEQIRYAEALDSAQAKQTLARVFAGAGGGLAVVGITLMVLSRNQENDTARTRVSLYCAPSKCRAQLSGTF